MTRLPVETLFSDRMSEIPVESSTCALRVGTYARWQSLEMLLIGSLCVSACNVPVPT
jgi:hypothetical protein